MVITDLACSLCIRSTCFHRISQLVPRCIKCERRNPYFVKKLVSLNRSVRVSILLIRRIFRLPLT